MGKGWYTFKGGRGEDYIHYLFSNVVVHSIDIYAEHRMYTHFVNPFYFHPPWLYMVVGYLGYTYLPSPLILGISGTPSLLPPSLPPSPPFPSFLPLSFLPNSLLSSSNPPLLLLHPFLFPSLPPPSSLKTKKIRNISFKNCISPSFVSLTLPSLKKNTKYKL